MDMKTIIGCSIGNCVHVAGVAHFLDIATDQGFRTIFLGPAVSVDDILASIEKEKPAMVCLGYRLTPENVLPIVAELATKSKALQTPPVWVFGGTRPVAESVATTGFFNKIFNGTEDIDDCIAFLRNTSANVKGENYAQTLVERIKQKSPYPLLRHHFGLPSFKDSVAGIEEIAKAKVLDVISLGIDQNTQQYFFKQKKRNPEMDGAGGVPVKTLEEFEILKAASKHGNFPLMRCYSGTDDIIPFAKVLKDTIDNAWTAVPLFWYNELDGRGARALETSIAEAQALVAWHVERGIPVELNEPHHWGLRDAHDTISVVMAYISAYNAKKLGVESYIAQFMFNIPNALSFSMDLAKVLAQIEMAESLKDDSFNLYRQVRTGLPFLSGDLQAAKGQLAASTMLQMAVAPHIIHVVGYSEAEHAATPDVVIESTKIVRGVIRSVLTDGADMTQDIKVQTRKQELIAEATYLLNYIIQKYSGVSADPLTDPAVLADCVRRGILDAPHILKNNKFKGILQTRIINGKCLAYNPKTKHSVNEEERLNMLKEAGNFDEENCCDKHGERRTINGGILHNKGV